jgi:phosphate acetyltransferase
MTPEGAEESGGDFLSLLRARAAERSKTLAYPEGLEPRVLDAVAECVSERLVGAAVLFADPEAVREGLSERGVDPAFLRVVDPADEVVVGRTLEAVRARRAGRDDAEEELARMARDPLYQAGVMLAEGTVDGVVAGCVRTTADVVRAGLVTVGLAEGIRTVSSAFYMVFGPDHPAGPTVLTFTDAGVVPRPTAEQLAGIAAAAAAARSAIVGDAPRVAFLSYSTKGSAEGESVASVRHALAQFRELMPHVASDGELQGDAALSPEVARRKAPGSEVAGSANILVFPDLSAANIGYKLVQYLAGAVALGPVVQGLAAPFNDLSRGAVVGDVVAVSCITALMAR